MDPEPAAPDAPGGPPAPPAAPGGPPAAPVVAEDYAAELRKKNNENRTLRTRLQELEAAQTAAQTAAQAAEAARLQAAGEFKQLAEARAARISELETLMAQTAREALVAREAHKAGLPEPLWTRVVGTTDDEIRADITGLLALIPPAAPPVPPRGGAPTSPARGGSGALTLELIRAMTPQEYGARRTEIQDFLAQRR